MVLGQGEPEKRPTQDALRPEQPPQKEARREAALRREALAPLKKKIGSVERALERIRGEIARLDSELAVPDLYAKDPEKAAELARERAGHAHDFARAESEWLDLSEELEAREADVLAN
jgi:ATP-binding cassette subfamily F protein 3